MTNAILVVNTGSSSIKTALFNIDDNLERLFELNLKNLFTDSPILEGTNCSGESYKNFVKLENFESGLELLTDSIREQLNGIKLSAIGHRIVHGGMQFVQPALISPEVVAEIESLTPLAPLHIPLNLTAIKFLSQDFPRLPHIACFDTAFHAAMPEKEKLFAIPRHFSNRGIRRFGFHGLSYEHIISVLPQYLGRMADGKIIAAHLGHGCSLCAMDKRKSVATTMSFSPLDGVPMATRSGAIDPGAIMYMQQNLGLSVEDLYQILYEKSGLLGVSGISGNISELMDNPEPAAQLAVEMFVYHIIRNIGALCAVLGGIDCLVFSGGIGENVPAVREKIINSCEWLGFKLDIDANVQNSSVITLKNSKVVGLIIPSNEERMIAMHTLNVISN